MDSPLTRDDGFQVAVGEPEVHGHGVVVSTEFALQNHCGLLNESIRSAVAMEVFLRRYLVRPAAKHEDWYIPLPSIET